MSDPEAGGATSAGDTSNAATPILTEGPTPSPLDAVIRPAERILCGCMTITQGMQMMCCYLM